MRNKKNTLEIKKISKVFKNGRFLRVFRQRFGTRISNEYFHIEKTFPICLVSSKMKRDSGNERSVPKWNGDFKLKQDPQIGTVVSKWNSRPKMNWAFQYNI